MADTLPNAPLQEAMIEVRWELEVSPINIPMDRGFELAVGAFWQSIRDEFKGHTRKAVGRAPEPFSIVHQFRRDEEGSPVIQMGHGILTVSHTHKNYSWEGSFLPLFKRLFKLLPDAYRMPLKFNRCVLRYTDAISVTHDDGTPPDMAAFMNDHMHVALANTIGEPYVPANFTIDTQFQLEDMTVVLSITTGMQSDDSGEMFPALIWQTTCTTKAGPLTVEQIEAWLEKAHDKQTDLFTRLCKPNLNAHFRNVSE